MVYREMSMRNLNNREREDNYDILFPFDSNNLLKCKYFVFIQFETYVFFLLISN